MNAIECEGVQKSYPHFKLNDIDLILLATCSADSLIPSAASIVQKKMEAKNAAAMDINAACSGFVYGLQVGTNMIRGGTHSTVLLIGAEKLHYVMDFTDRATCILFGDGAGAVVLSASDEDGGGMAGLEMTTEITTEWNLESETETSPQGLESDGYRIEFDV